MIKRLTKNSSILVLFLLIAGTFFTSKASASSLTQASDTITTSRPSAAATLSANLTSSSTAAEIGDKGDIFLASDSAILSADTGETLEKVTVASMSATGVPIPSQKMVYFTTATANSHHVGDVVIVNITATHLIKFNTNAAVPSGGHIILTFPTTSANTASPSATGFSFNGLSSGNMSTYVQCNPSNACGGSSQSVSGNTITLTTTGAVSGTVYISVGCQSGVSSSGICTTPSPLLINPTVSSTQCSGSTCTAGATNDVWKITVQTTDTNSVTLDSARVIVGTIESVQVQAQVEPTLTFAITGLANTTNYNTTVSQCGSEASNTGIDSTATTVNLGILNNAQINRAAQTLTVTTNEAFGYTVTASSSGRLISPASGLYLPDANGGSGLTTNLLPAPAAMTAATPAFGISPCGVDVPTSSPNWGGTGQTVASGALFANPWNSAGNAYAMTLASYTGGPSNGTTATHGVTLVRYGATVAGTTASGVYTTTLTYTATPSF